MSASADSILVFTTDNAAAQRWCVGHGLVPIPITSAPTADEITSAGRLLVDPVTFEQVRGDALANSVALVYIAEGSEDPIRSVYSRGQALAKRVVDLVGGGALVLASAPVLAIAALAIKLDSKGPVIISQTRVGVDGRRIRIHKLRSMRTDTDAKQHHEYFARLAAGQAEQFDGLYKMKGDPRITRVGRVLRKFSLDEIPQLFDVVRGDMSLCGPRPALPNELGTYNAAAWMRLRTKPGCTGLWQVNGRATRTFDEMIALDVGYWRDWSLANELRILAMTPAALLRGETA